MDSSNHGIFQPHFADSLFPIANDGGCWKPSFPGEAWRAEWDKADIELVGATRCCEAKVLSNPLHP